METGIHNTSEIGRLKKVLLHRPGGELENLMPEYLERLLFDDIPYLKEAQREHDAFADCLRQQGVEVVYLRDLVAESITDGEMCIRDRYMEDQIVGLLGGRVAEQLCLGDISTGASNDIQRASQIARKMRLHHRRQRL